MTSPPPAEVSAAERPDRPAAESSGAARRPSGLTRRRFLVASGVTGAAAVAGGAWTLTHHDAATVLGHAATTRPQAPGTGVLVLVTLYGGNDALGMVAPVGDSAYAAARGSLALTDSLPLADGLALAPGMKSLKAQWDAGRLAVVRGVGYPQQDHSHFRSMAIWQTGSPTTSVSSGWVGRWLDAQQPDPLLAVAVGPTPPPLVVGARAVGACVPVGPFALPTDAAGTGARTFGATGYADALQQAVATSARDLGTVSAQVSAALAAVPASDAGAGSLDDGGAATSTLAGELGDQLDVVARCIRAGVPTRVWSVSLGGFDTHAAEKATQDALLGQLDTALGAFLDQVQDSPHAAGLVVQVSSEFGRRVTPNGSGGTDHGTAAPVLLVGPGVKGGTFGDQPSLTDLVDGDLRTTTDFRDVYATVLAGVLGADPGVVFPGETRATLGFL